MPKRNRRNNFPTLFTQESAMKFVSGGQTGADRGGLEAGKILGFETGGWVPKGWRTENGPDPTLATFGCKEHLSSDYPPRTRVNVAYADGTIWFGRTGSPGYKCTYNATVEFDSLFIVNPTSQELLDLVKERKIRICNISGNRESKNPGIQRRTKDFLIQTFSQSVK